MSEESVIGKNIWYREEVGCEWKPGVILKIETADIWFEKFIMRKVVAVVKNTKTGMVNVVPAHLGINFNSDPKTSN